MTRVLPTQGRPSKRWPHLGVWQMCLGPNSPIPGPRLQLVILDTEGKVVRRMEQIEGACIDEGYVDFFLSHNCRPAVHEHPMVDIDAAGNIAEVLHPDYRQELGMDIYLKILENWALKYGKPEYAL